MKQQRFPGIGLFFLTLEMASHACHAVHLSAVRLFGSRPGGVTDWAWCASVTVWALYATGGDQSAGGWKKGCGRVVSKQTNEPASKEMQTMGGW
jgi:hypothetical protein